MIQLMEGLPDAVVGLEAVGQVRIRRLRGDRGAGGEAIPGELQLFPNRDRKHAEAWASEGLDAT